MGSCVGTSPRRDALRTREAQRRTASTNIYVTHETASAGVTPQDHHLMSINIALERTTAKPHAIRLLNENLI